MDVVILNSGINLFFFSFKKDSCWSVLPGNAQRLFFAYSPILQYSGSLRNIFIRQQYIEASPATQDFLLYDGIQRVYTKKTLLAPDSLSGCCNIDRHGYRVYP